MGLHTTSNAACMYTGQVCTLSTGSYFTPAPVVPHGTAALVHPSLYPHRGRESASPRYRLGDCILAGALPIRSALLAMASFVLSRLPRVWQRGLRLYIKERELRCHLHGPGNSFSLAYFLFYQPAYGTSRPIPRRLPWRARPPGRL